MSHLRSASGRIVAAARDAGIRVTEDPRSLNPPTLIVEPVATVRRKQNAVSVELLALLVAPGPLGSLDALNRIADMADELTPHLDADGLSWSDARASTYETESGDQLMCYELRITVSTDI